MVVDIACHQDTPLESRPLQNQGIRLIDQRPAVRGVNALQIISGQNFGYHFHQTRPEVLV